MDTSHYFHGTLARLQISLLRPAAQYSSPINEPRQARFRSDTTGVWLLLHDVITEIPPIMLREGGRIPESLCHFRLGTFQFRSSTESNDGSIKCGSKSRIFFPFLARVPRVSISNSNILSLPPRENTVGFSQLYRTPIHQNNRSKKNRCHYPLIEQLS